MSGLALKQLLMSEVLLSLTKAECVGLKALVTCCTANTSWAVGVVLSSMIKHHYADRYTPLMTVNDDLTLGSVDALDDTNFSFVGTPLHLD